MNNNFLLAISLISILKLIKFLITHIQILHIYFYCCLDDLRRLGCSTYIVVQTYDDDELTFVISKNFSYCSILFTLLRGTFKSKAPLRVQFSPALVGVGGGKGLKPKLLLGFTK